MDLEREVSSDVKTPQFHNFYGEVTSGRTNYCSLNLSTKRENNKSEETEKDS